VDDIVFNLFTQRLQEELSLNSDVEGIYHVWHGGEDSEVKSQRAFQALVQERLYSRASDITFGIRKKDDCVGHGGTSVSPPIDSKPLGNSAS